MSYDALPPKSSHPWVRRFVYVPLSPDGRTLFHLKGHTKLEAIQKLLKDNTPKIQFATWENFKKLGYTIRKIERI